MPGAETSNPRPFVFKSWCAKLLASKFLLYSAWGSFLHLDHRSFQQLLFLASIGLWEGERQKGKNRYASYPICLPLGEKKMW